VLCRPGSLLAIDETSRGGHLAGEATDIDTVALRRLKRRLHGDQRIDFAPQPIGEGMTLSRGRGQIAQIGQPCTN
jgi:predicted O-methyltransferase YrrM